MTMFYNADGDGPRHLLVYLHGHGGRPEGVAAFAREYHDDGLVRLCPAAPYPVDDGFSWFDTGPRGVDAVSLRRSVDGLVALVDAARTDLGLGWADVVLGGFSQGAATVVALAAALGARGAGGTEAALAGVLLQAGFVPEVFGDEVALDRIAARSVLVQHGTDDAVVPPFMSKDLAEALGAVATVDDVEVQFPVGGHELSPMMEAGAVRWLARVAE